VTIIANFWFGVWYTVVVVLVISATFHGVVPLILPSVALLALLSFFVGCIFMQEGGK
jgi:hypothetical protein